MKLQRNIISYRSNATFIDGIQHYEQIMYLYCTRSQNVVFVFCDRNQRFGRRVMHNYGIVITVFIEILKTFHVNALRFSTRNQTAADAIKRC